MEKWSDPPPLLFIEKVHNFWTQKKCPKAMDWPRPPPPLRKNSIREQHFLSGMLPLVDNYSTIKYIYLVTNQMDNIE